jgi:hypothetical protein
MRDEFSFFARAKTRSIVSLSQPPPKFCDQLVRTSRERANLTARLTVTDRTCSVGNLNGDEIRGVLALRAVARLTIHCRARTIEDHLEAKIGVRDAAIRPREACEDALALAAQVLDRFEQVAAAGQESRI